MSDSPSISAIITGYDRETQLLETLNCISSCIPPPDEILVHIDGGKEPHGPLLETCKIIFRHFGLAHTLKWFLHGHSKNLHRAAHFFKNAFWRE